MATIIGLNMWYWTKEEREEHEKYLEKIRALVKKVKEDPSYGMKLLIDAGIYDENGELTEHYK